MYTYSVCFENKSAIFSCTSQQIGCMYSCLCTPCTHSVHTLCMLLMGKNDVFSHAPASKKRPKSTKKKVGQNRLHVQLLVYTVYTVYTQKIVQCTQRTQQCTQSVHTCQMFTTSGRVQLYTVRQYRMSVRCMAATDIRISTSSREFSTRIFLPTQIYRILENFFDFSKVPDRYGTSWNSELHSRR